MVIELEKNKLTLQCLWIFYIHVFKMLLSDNRDGDTD